MSAPRIADWTPASLRALPEPLRTQLQTGPLAAVLLVAAADGTIERDEVSALLGWIDEASKRPGPMAALFPGGHSDAMALLTAIQREKKSPRALLALSIAALREAVLPAAGRLYADEIRALALAVANASRGPGWLSFASPRICDKEQATLNNLDRLLEATVGAG